MPALPVLLAWFGGLGLALALSRLAPRGERLSWGKGILAVAFPASWYTLFDGQAQVAEAFAKQPDWALPVAHGVVSLLVHTFFGVVGLTLSRALATDPETLERLELLRQAEIRERKEARERAARARRAEESKARNALEAEARAEEEAAAAKAAAASGAPEYAALEAAGAESAPAAAPASEPAPGPAGAAPASAPASEPESASAPESSAPEAAPSEEAAVESPAVDPPAAEATAEAPGPSAAVAALIRPAGDTVAAATGTDADRERLLTALRHGPDPHRAASARAAGLVHAGSDDLELGDALVAVVLDGAAAVSARAECWIALRAILSEPLDTESALRTRQYFPEGLDVDWLEARGLAPGS